MAFRSLRSQQGNTLVGIVIGLVIGLVIAVVVALMITKGQSPFTDRAPKNGKPADEASGQIADARSAYERALAVDIRFMDLSDRIHKLSAGQSA